MAIKHAFTSGKSDGADATLVKPSDWNAGHTIDAATVTLAQLADVSATQRVIGRNSAGAGVPQEVTASQLLDWVSSTNGVLLTRTGGTWAALANVTTDNGDLVFADNAAPVAPGASKIKIAGANIGGRMMPAGLGPTGARMAMQPCLYQQHYFAWTTGLNNTVTQLGMINGTATGTATGRAPATTNAFTLARRVGMVSSSTAANVGGYRCTTAFLTRQQGFHCVFRFGLSDAGATETTGRKFVGLRDDPTAPTDQDPSGFVNVIAVGCNANDTTMQLYAAGAAAQARAAIVIASGPNAGGAFPMNTTSTAFYELAIYAPPGGTTLTWSVTRLDTGDFASGTVAAGANLVVSTAVLTPMVWRSNGSTAVAVGIDLIQMSGDTDV